jgi:hypothetical protein
MTCLCGNPLEEGRAALGLPTCLPCAQARPAPRYRGAMIYGHKTAGAICLMSPDEFSHYKKLTNRRGQSSVLRNVIVANGRAL